MKKNTNINYDKVICWEHPNYATTIIKNLDNNLLKSKIKNIPNIYFDDLSFIKKEFTKKIKFILLTNSNAGRCIEHNNCIVFLS